MFVRVSLFILFALEAAAAFAAEDPYRVLGVHRNAGQAALDAAYQRMLVAYPEGVPAEVREAYLTLSDPAKRLAVDRSRTRLERVRDFVEWREQVAVELIADYQLRHPSPAMVRAGYLRMLTVEQQTAWNEMFPAGDSTKPRDREAFFWNDYRNHGYSPWVRVLQLAIAEAPRFLATQPSLAEAQRFLTLIDMRQYLWIAAAKSRNATRLPNEEENQVTAVAMQFYAAFLDGDRLIDPEEIAVAISEWWKAARYAKELDRGPIRVDTWIRSAATRLNVTPVAFWSRLAATMRGSSDSAIPVFEALIPSLVRVVPARVLFDELKIDVQNRARTGSRADLVTASSDYGSAVTVLAAADATLAEELRWAASGRGSVTAIGSASVRCVRALAQAAAKHALEESP